MTVENKGNIAAVSADQSGRMKTFPFAQKIGLFMRVKFSDLSQIKKVLMFFTPVVYIHKGLGQTYFKLTWVFLKTETFSVGKASIGSVMEPFSPGPT